MSTKYIASNWRLPNKAGVDSYLNDNYGLTFDGSEFISAGTPLNGLTTFSLSIWAFRSTDQALNDGIIAYQDSTANFWKLFFSSSTDSTEIKMLVRPLISMGDSANTSFVTSNTGAFPLNQWVHIVVTSDGVNRMKMYVNGVENIAAQEHRPGTLTQTTNLIIGRDPCCGGRYFDGKLSEVAIFDYALSSTQISTLYGSSSLGAGNPMALKPAPVAYYPLGDNSSGNPLTQPNEAVEDASVFNFDSSSNSFIQANNVNLDSANKFTVSLWLKNTSDSFEEFFSIYTGSSMNFFIGRRAGNRLDIYFGSFIYQSSVLNTNSFDNIIVVFDGTQASNTDKIKCFVNGDQISLSGSTSNTSLPSGSKIIYLGRRGSTYLDGELSNVAVWNSDQSSEISNIYNSGVPATTYTNTPTAWYKLDQSANWEADTSGAWQIPDAVSAYPQSFDFIDGNDTFIDCGANENILDFSGNDYTVSAWVNWDGTGDTNQMIASVKSGGSNVDFALTIEQSSGKISYWNGSTYVQSNSAIPTGSWCMVTIIVKATQKDFFINGVADGTPSQTRVASAAAGTKFYIGRSDLTIEYFNGKISNVQIFNTALPATGTDSVETLYNNGVPLTTAIATDNLKAWYKLDNTATFSTNWSIPDASGNGNTGTSSGMTEQNLVNNNVSALNGESNGMTSANLVLTDLTRNLPYDSYSFNFDSASSDYINLGNPTALQFTSDLSISGWFKTSSTSAGRIIGKDNVSNRSYVVQVQSDGSVIGVIFESNSTAKLVTSSTGYNDSNWHHFGFTYEEGVGLKLYIDGGTPATLSYTSAPNFNQAANVEIGRRGDGSNYFNGKINNLSIFNEALTSTEVLKLYSNGMPQDLSSFTPAPVAWWTLGSNSFFNGSNFICKDLSGNGNDGTSVNAGVDALQGNTPRSEANGTGTNMDIPTNLEGQTKYSSNNSWSINMSESARVADTP